MDNIKTFGLFTLLLITYLISRPSLANQYTEAAKVVKINKGVVFTSNGASFQGVIKGLKSGSPYRPYSGTISKSKILSYARSSGKFLLTRHPYFAVALAAAGYFLDSDSGQVNKSYPSEVQMIGSCGSNQGLYLLPDGSTTTQLSDPGRTQVTMSACQAHYDGLSGGYGAHACETNHANQWAITWDPNCGTATWGWFFTKYDDAVVTENVSFDQVPDDEVWNDISAYAATNSNYAHELFNDDLSNPNQEIMPDNIQYNPYAADSEMAALMQQIRDGIQHQSSDPNAANYVVPEKLQAALEAIAKQDTAATPQGTADSLNDQLDPAGEESAKSIADITDSLNSDDDIGGLDDSWESITQAINDTTALPDLNPIVGYLPQASVCQSIDLSIMGTNFTFPGATGCQRLTTAKKLIGYFLMILTLIGCVSVVLQKPHD